MALRHGNDDSEVERATAFSSLDEGMAEYLRQCLHINPEDLQNEFVRVPGDLAFWNARYAAALRAHLHSKLDEKVLYANLEPVVRKALIDAGAKVTVDMVKAAIDSHDDYVAAQRKTIDAEVEKNECFGRLDAIRSKRDMIVSLGAQIRAEMQADPSVREQMRTLHGHGS